MRFDVNHSILEALINQDPYSISISSYSCVPKLEASVLHLLRFLTLPFFLLDTKDIYILLVVVSTNSHSLPVRDPMFQLPLWSLLLVLLTVNMILLSLSTLPLEVAPSFFSMLITGDCLDYIAFVKACLNEQFHMSNLGPLSFFLGIEVTSTPDGYYLSQRKYIQDIIDRAGHT